MNHPPNTSLRVYNKSKTQKDLPLPPPFPASVGLINLSAFSVRYRYSKDCQNLSFAARTSRRPHPARRQRHLSARTFKIKTSQLVLNGLNTKKVVFQNCFFSNTLAEPSRREEALDAFLSRSISVALGLIGGR